MQISTTFVHQPVWLSHRLCLSLCLLLATTISSLAQTGASFRHFDKADGLSQSSVFAVAQDHAGFMWFGTRDGLNRFDGHDFRCYRASDDIVSGPLGSDVRSLKFEAAHDRLWIGTTDGLSCYTPHNDRFEHFATPSGAVRSIHIAESGTLWVGTSKGLFRRSNTDTAFVEIIPEGEALTAINVIHCDGLNLWVGTGSGLLRIRDESGTYRSSYPAEALSSSTGRSVKALYQAPNGSIFVGTYASGLYRYDPSSNSTKQYLHQTGQLNSLPNDNVRALCSDGNSGLWIGTFYGLGYLDLISGEFTTVRSLGLREDELSDNSIRALFVDQRGSLWAGTYYGGVNQFDPSNERFQTFMRTPGEETVSADIISSFAEDAAGNLYVGTEGGGLDYYDRRSQTFRHYAHDPADPTSLSGSNVKSLLLDGEYLWVGTFSRGLNRLDLSTGRFTRFDMFGSLPQNQDQPATQSAHTNVYSLVRRGDQLWAATYGGGLSVYNVAGGQFADLVHASEESGALPSNFVRALHSTPSDFLMGGDAGLHRIHIDGNDLPERYEELLGGVRVHAIHPDAQGRIWVGTLNSGMFVIDEQADTTHRYTINDGLPGNTVFGILGDERGKLWLSTNNGLARFDPQLAQSTTFDHPSGLLNGEFNFGSYLKLHTGELVFGGLHGFTLFDPAAMDDDTFVPPLALSSFTHNGKAVRPAAEGLLESSINRTEHLTFRYNDASFGVSLSALDYITPESNRLEYMLTGLDNDWNVARGKADISYTIQREGDYQLRVRSINPDGVVNPTERALNITVLPPPWRTNWAYALYVLLGVGVIIAVIRFINLRHEYELEHVARQRDEDLHEGKLRFFTNITHEFRTPLTLMVGPLTDLLNDDTLDLRTRAKLQGIEQNSRKLLNLVDRVLTFRKLSSDHGRMRGKKLDLNWFLLKINEPFASEAQRRRIKLQLDLPNETLHLWGDRRMLEMATTALLSNAMKFTPNGGHIRLSAKRLSSDQLQVEVADNGPGVPAALKDQVFKRYFEDSESGRSAGTGIGLAVANELVALHQGTLQVSDTPGGGATFTMFLPIGAEHFGASTAGGPDELGEIVGLTPIPQLTEQEFALAEEDQEEGESEPTPVVSHNDQQTETRSRILIVEDNTELRNYLYTIFEEGYDVDVAADGAQALKIARGHKAPDLILSDVMMPVMDGGEMCEQLKADLATSHIPVLLLTAKTSEPARLEGLRHGADDYISKPFLPEELQLRVRNVLRTRKQIREAFGRVVDLSPSEIAVTSADEEFLVNALAFVEEYIDDVDLNVNRMAQAVNVSRALLFTKLKSLTGQTPSHFVKTVRLKRAAQLLQTGKLNVSEVAYRVGFRDPKYFSKCFKEVYGVAASGYAATLVADS